jgi:hypothetical protein
MNERIDSKFLSFIEKEPKPKTKVFEVRARYAGCFLGDVKWYAPWRKYCFFPGYSLDLVFDANCLNEIREFMNRLMAERR